MKHFSALFFADTPWRTVSGYRGVGGRRWRPAGVASVGVAGGSAAPLLAALRAFGEAW